MSKLMSYLFQENKSYGIKTICIHPLMLHHRTSPHVASGTLIICIMSKVQSRRYLAVTPLSARFYCYFKPAKSERSPDGCGPQPGEVPVRIPISFRSWDVQLSQINLSLFLSGLMLPHHPRQIPGTVALCYTPSKYQ